MIKLTKLINEGSRDIRPSPELDKMLIRTKVHPFSGYVFHGSPLDGLKSILTSRIIGVEHGEIAEYDTFSTSVNDEVLRLFSDGNGYTGLSFDVKNARLLIVDDILHKLLIVLPGSGMDVDVDPTELEKFAIQYKLPMDRGEFYLPYDYISSLGVDGFVFDYTWKRIEAGHSMRLRDEHEICFVGRGIDKLNNEISEIYVNDESFDANQKAEAIEAIEKEL